MLASFAKALHNLSCIETRFRLLCCWKFISLNLVFRQRKLYNIFIFGMAYCCGFCTCFLCQHGSRHMEKQNMSMTASFNTVLANQNNHAQSFLPNSNILPRNDRRQYWSPLILPGFQTVFISLLYVEIKFCPARGANGRGEQRAIQR